jgi:hypothetical protein
MKHNRLCRSIYRTKLSHSLVMLAIGYLREYATCCVSQSNCESFELFNRVTIMQTLDRSAFTYHGTETSVFQIQNPNALAKMSENGGLYLRFGGRFAGAQTEQFHSSVSK